MQCGGIMLATKHDCHLILVDMKNRGMDISEDLHLLRDSNVISKKVVSELVERNNEVCDFYLRLNNKAHKIIKELLSLDERSIGSAIKTATSLITQGIIAIEHLYSVDDINGQNNFIECVGLKELADGISEYFGTGKADKLLEALNNNRTDVKLLLD